MVIKSIPHRKIPQKYYDERFIEGENANITPNGHHMLANERKKAMFRMIWSDSRPHVDDDVTINRDRPMHEN